ncbi:MAG: hypothetical protein P4L40_26640, partial [Terracidiphilus sp.]|nr:hypothetical protein [Terracidiphilus sp.]
ASAAPAGVALGVDACPPVAHACVSLIVNEAGTYVRPRRHLRVWRQALMPVLHGTRVCEPDRE